MSTPVLVRLNGQSPEAVIAVGQDKEAIEAALARFSCTAPTVGTHLARLVSRLLSKAWRENQQQVKTMLGRQMPMLTAKEKLMALVAKCGVCNGAGCPVCGNNGFVD